jgi:cyclophilin family peptidyl-prolyl cis-trans isomerase
VAPLEEAHGDDLRFVFRHFPLISIHPVAMIAAEAAEAAAAQGAFWEMHDLLYERVSEWSSLSEDQAIGVFVGFAQGLGLDVDRYRRDLEDHTFRQKVEESYQQAVSLGLGGTPSFIVNGSVVPSGMPLDGFIDLTVGDPPPSFDGPPPQVIDPSKMYLATIQTSQGTVVVEMLPEVAPTNVNSFAFLAQNGWYDGQAFFFVRPGTIAYSGDPTSRGLVLPFAGFVCEDELSPDATFDEAGVVGMYKPAANQNSGLFFITMDAIPDFNGEYTVLGRVIEGLDVVRRLAAVQPGDGLTPDSIETIVVEER